MNLRGAVIALFILVAALLQVGVASRLGLPGAAPDVLLVSVIAIAVQRGGTIGAIVGIIAGMFSDLLPPGAPLLGVSAIIFGVLGGLSGWLAGRDRKRNQESSWRVLLFAGLASVAGVLLNTVIIGLLDSQRVASPNFLSLLFWQGVYAMILAAVIVPLYDWLDRLTEPTPVVSRRN